MPDKKNFATRLERWFEENKRSLPWRETTDPYRIWISEIILQQTRVAQGLDYYRRFIGRFPDVHELAVADEDEVLKYWEGLGYYSRARNLHAAARQVMRDFEGRFPDTYEGIRSLKGVGDYTAAAIASFAYGFGSFPDCLPLILLSIRRQGANCFRLWPMKCSIVVIRLFIIRRLWNWAHCSVCRVHPGVPTVRFSFLAKLLPQVRSICIP
mgnify:CR=1 FL=1